MKTYSLYPVLRVDKPNKNGTCSLYIRYTYGKVWKNISLNKTLEPSYWNKEENEPRKNCPNRKEILDLIRRKKTEIETIVLELSREDGEYPSPEELINNISNGKNRNIKNWVYYFDLFVKNQTENLNVEPSTLEVYRQSKEKLNGFQTEKDISFLNRFFVYKKVSTRNAEKLTKALIDQLPDEEQLELSGTMLAREAVLEAEEALKPKVKKLGKKISLQEEPEIKVAAKKSRKSKAVEIVEEEIAPAPVLVPVLDPATVHIEQIPSKPKKTTRKKKISNIEIVEEV